jgi:hypothetical protein
MSENNPRISASASVDSPLIAGIVSGGQTGVDRAALDSAMARGIPHGGWCPKGRRAEDGPIAGRYALQETRSAAYPVRTRWNVRDSDGTLVLVRGTMDRGTQLTIDLSLRLSKPVFVVNLLESPTTEEIVGWIRAEHIQVLNIAGPRESSSPGIYQTARAFLKLLFSAPALQQ